MTREEILAEIRLTAASNGGRPVGQRRFTEITGITPWAWGRYWARWGDAQREAGFKPNLLNAAFDNDLVLRRYVELTRELGRVPTHGELRLRRQQDPSFPDVKTFTRRGHGSKNALIGAALSYCHANPEYAGVTSIYEAEYAGEAAAADENGRRPVGFVYLARGRKGEFKIGRSNLVDRRIGEVGATLPMELALIHEIKTDDPVGVEAYWHRRFEDQRMRGEWFRLSAADVNAFKRWRRIY